ncbi:hypothetical protein SAMN05216428_12313 [Nitrosospira sp. Nsp11]|nr:hypothetical protein SAMN05216428_12313 [Nitrosospira sp. Nsp11]
MFNLNQTASMKAGAVQIAQSPTLLIRFISGGFSEAVTVPVLIDITRRRTSCQ